MTRWWRSLVGLALVVVGVAVAAPSKVGIVVAFIPLDASEATALQVIQRLKALRTQSALNIPMTAYYFDRADEQQVCAKLHIQKQDLPFVGIVRLDAGGHPVEMLNRLPDVKDATAADAAFGKVEALLGVAVPKPTPSPQPTVAATTGLAAEITNPQDGSVLVLVPAGAFTMGSDKMETAKPAQRLTLPAFYIGKYDVTNAQFQQFVAATGYQAEGDWKSDMKWGDAAPVQEVTWNDAMAYCRWAGVRLPTEAEWEKAARGTDEREYPWGRVWDSSRCRCSQTVRGDVGSPSPVGTYPSGASPYGCQDMSGNALQWCSTVFLPYPYDATDGREGATGQVRHVIRGSSWDYVYEQSFRTFMRSGYLPGLAHRVLDGTPVGFGFRVARTP